MYSEQIVPKVTKMFNNLRKQSEEIINNSASSHTAVTRIVELVAAVTSSRSNSILTDMLYDLTNTVLETQYFQDISLQNQFLEMNLRQEILDRYQFSASKVDYQEASRAMQALKVGGSVFAIGGIGELGYVLVKGLKISNLVPLPVGVLVAFAFGAALMDYLAIEPSRSKMKFKHAVDIYLRDTQKQFLQWFDDIEIYFNERVEEFKRTH